VRAPCCRQDPQRMARCRCGQSRLETIRMDPRMSNIEGPPISWPLYISKSLCPGMDVDGIKAQGRTDSSRDKRLTRFDILLSPACLCLLRSTEYQPSAVLAGRNTDIIDHPCAHRCAGKRPILGATRAACSSGRIGGNRERPHATVTSAAPVTSWEAAGPGHKPAYGKLSEKVSPSGFAAPPCRKSAHA
jgi:hypothetical protein